MKTPKYKLGQRFTDTKLKFCFFCGDIFCYIKKIEIFKSNFKYTLYYNCKHNLHKHKNARKIIEKSLSSQIKYDRLVPLNNITVKPKYRIGAVFKSPIKTYDGTLEKKCKLIMANIISASDYDIHYIVSYNHYGSTTLFGFYEFELDQMIKDKKIKISEIRWDQDVICKNKEN